MFGTMADNIPDIPTQQLRKLEIGQFCIKEGGLDLKEAGVAGVALESSLFHVL